MMQWPHQTLTGALSEQYKKDDNWLMSTASMKSQADMGSAMIYQTGSRSSMGAPGLRPSTSAASLGSSHASVPMLRIRDRERNPVLGCLPDEVRARACFLALAVTNGKNSPNCQSLTCCDSRLPQVAEMRDWSTTMRASHRELPMNFRGSGGAGLETRFGIKDRARMQYPPPLLVLLLPHAQLPHFFLWLVKRH